MDRKSGGLLAIIAVPVVILTAVFGMILLTSSAAASCNPTGSSAAGVTIDPKTVPDTTISGYGHEQLVNAAYVIQAGKDLSLSARDQTIGVMTAMGESGLRVLNYGDAAGPDSRGLFQQRANGAWGSLADRMDPYISATNFFKKLATITDRDSLAPTIAAHKVQVNADPYYYAKYWDAAVAVVEGLTGAKIGLTPGTGNQVCSGVGTGTVTVSPQGWALPAAGPISDPFGMRVNPISGVYKLHAGVDIAGGCDSPIYDAQSGTVVASGFGVVYGSNGTIVRVVNRGFQATTDLRFEVLERPASGTIRVLSRRGGRVELHRLTSDMAESEAWMAKNRYCDPIAEIVGEDEAGAAPVGRAA